MKVKTGREHSKLYHFLWIITWLLFFPFVILSILHELIDVLLEFLTILRCKIVYTIMEFLFERSNKNE